jgi:hypothetical protein
VSILSPGKHAYPSKYVLDLANPAFEMGCLDDALAQRQPARYNETMQTYFGLQVWELSMMTGVPCYSASYRFPDRLIRSRCRERQVRNAVAAFTVAPWETVDVPNADISG